MSPCARDTMTGTFTLLLWMTASCGGGTAVQPDAAVSQPDGASPPPADAAPVQADAAARPDAMTSSTGCYHLPAPPATGVNIGAIRYDAWFTEPEDPPLINIFPLFAHQWFERAPFNAFLSANGTWGTGSDRQSVIDREIDYAVTRGIDYWAFVYGRFVARNYETGAYPAESEVTYGPYFVDHLRQGAILDRYLSSDHCDKPKFALIVGSGGVNDYVNVWRLALSKVTRETAWQHILVDLSGYLKRPEQLKTPDGRPIMFIFDGDAWGSVWDGDPVLARQKLEELRQAAIAVGAGRPFIVTLNPPEQAAFAVRMFGFDGVSQYGWSPGLNGDLPGIEVPWSDADFGVDWAVRTDMDEYGLDVIPPVTSGWDHRPQLPLDSLYSPSGKWYPHATPEQIVNQLDHAIQLVKTHSSNATAKSVLMYAWNELAEGGVLTPTLAEGSVRIDAIARYLGKTIPPTSPVLPPVLIPRVTKNGTGCDGGYGIWMLGTNFDPDSRVQVRAAQVGREREAILATYDPVRGEAEGMQSLAFCLTGTADRSAFAAEGVRVFVVNPTRPSISTPFVTRLGD